MAAPERPAPSRPEAQLVMLTGRTFAPSDVPVLCEGIRVGTGDDTDPVVCDVSALVDPDLETVDGLARLALALRRRGYRVRIGQAPAELIGLMALVGLADVVPCAEPSQPAGSPQPAGSAQLEESAVEARRQTEHREEPRGVEEEDNPADAPA